MRVFRTDLAAPAASAESLVPLNRLWAIPGIVLAALVCILLPVLILLPLDWWFVPAVPPEIYVNRPLRLVLSQLEASHVIPAGTSWPEPDLGSRLVSARFLHRPPATDALETLAQSASVVIELPWRQFCLGGGVIRGPVRVRSVRSGENSGLQYTSPFATVPGASTHPPNPACSGLRFARR